MNKSLSGLRVLNTRPKAQAVSLSKNITDAGGQVIELPTIEIKALSNQWMNSLPDLNSINTAIFISANAVHCCFKQLKSKKRIWPEHIKVIAIGQASAKALQEYQIKVWATPQQPDSEHLLELSLLNTIKNQSVLLFKGEGGRPLIESNLIQKGARLTSLLVYKREMPNINHQLVQSIWRDDLVDIILVTSEQSFHNLLKMFGTDAQNWLKTKTFLVISERLAKAVAASDMKKIIISHPDRMMDTLLDYYQGSIHGQ